MTKRILALLLACMMAAVTGCSSSQTSSSSASETSSAAPVSASESASEAAPTEIKPAKIHWWTAWAPEKGIQEIIDKFNEQYPQIEVVPVQFSNNTDGNLKVDTTLAAGSGIDVFFNFGVDMLDSRATKNLLLDLTPYIERDKFDVAGELGSDIYTLDGKYYSLPATNNAYCVFLNKEMLDAAGLKTPTSWTMDEYYEYARKMTKGTGNEKVFGSDGLRPYHQWLYMASNSFAKDPWYNDKGEANFDHPYYKKVLEAKFNAEEVEKIQYPYTEYMSTKASTADNFLNGKAAMAIYGNSLARNLTDLEKYPHEFTVEVAPLPVAEQGATNYNIGGYYGYMGVNAKTTEAEASWTFLKYLVTEGSYGFLKVGHLPTWKKTNWDSVVKDSFGETPERFINVEQFKNVILNQAGMPQQVQTNFTARTEITDIINTELEALIFGMNKAEVTVANLKTQADAAIAKSK